MSSRVPFGLSGTMVFETEYVPCVQQPIDFIVTIEDHYTFNRDVYEQSLREANARSFAVQALELSVLSAVC